MAAGICVDVSVSHVPPGTDQRVLESHVQERTNEIEQSMEIDGYKPKGPSSRKGAQTGAEPLRGLFIGEVEADTSGNMRSKVQLSSLGMAPGAPEASFSYGAQSLHSR